MTVHHCSERKEIGTLVKHRVDHHHLDANPVPCQWLIHGESRCRIPGRTFNLKLLKLLLSSWWENPQKPLKLTLETQPDALCHAWHTKRCELLFSVTECHPAFECHRLHVWHENALTCQWKFRHFSSFQNVSHVKAVSVTSDSFLVHHVSPIVFNSLNKFH
jgi:hypothetical protein